MNPNSPDDYRNTYQDPNQQSQQPVPTSIDYLNEIAGPSKVNMLSPLLLWGVIGGVLLMVGIVVAFLLGGTGPSSTEQLSSLTARMQAIRSVHEVNNEFIQSSNLRSYSSTASTLLGGAIQDSSAVYSVLSIEPPEDLPEDSPLNAEFAELNANLEDAKLNVVFDRTYAREMGYQLEQLLVEMDALYTSSNNEAVKAYLQKTSDNIAPVIEQFNSWNNTES